METRAIAGAMALPLLVVLHLAAVSPAFTAETEAVPVLTERLPSEPFACAISGAASRPDAVLRGRPGVLLFLDAADGGPSDLERFLGRMQEQFAPWLRWGVVLTGRSGARADTLRRLSGNEPLRVEHCWRDPDGAWRSSFRIPRLPAAALVSASGYVTARQVGLRPEEEPRFQRALERLVSSGLLSGRPVRDFKLEESVSGAPTTFADLPRRDYTLLLSLRADCQPCREELRLLRAAGLRYPGRMTLVTIAHDETGPEASPSRAPASPAGCDLTLRDSGMLYAERYALAGVPTLLVVDRGGTIVLARQGFRPEEADALARDLEELLGRPAAPGGDEGRFAEFLRIRAEALALLGTGRPGIAALFLERALELVPDFYTVQLLLAQAYLGAGARRDAAQAYARYLAAEPRAGDRGAVLANMRTLAAAQ